MSKPNVGEQPCARCRALIVVHCVVLISGYLNPAALQWVLVHGASVNCCGNQDLARLIVPSGTELPNAKGSCPNFLMLFV